MKKEIIENFDEYEMKDKNDSTSLEKDTLEKMKEMIKKVNLNGIVNPEYVLNEYKKIRT